MNQIASIDAQWISIAGLLANILGFCVIGFEWRTAMYDGLNRLEMEQDLLLLASGKETSRELEISPVAKRLIEEADLGAIVGDTARFETFTKTLLILDSVDRLNRRRAIFTMGFLIVIVGSLAQLVASWPR